MGLAPSCQVLRPEPSTRVCGRRGCACPAPAGPCAAGGAGRGCGWGAGAAGGLRPGCDRGDCGLRTPLPGASVSSGPAHPEPMASLWRGGRQRYFRGVLRVSWPHRQAPPCQASFSLSRGHLPGLRWRLSLSGARPLLHPHRAPRPRPQRAPQKPASPDASPRRREAWLPSRLRVRAGDRGAGGRVPVVSGR